jgi:hypothetical protein
VGESYEKDGILKEFVSSICSIGSIGSGKRKDSSLVRSIGSTRQMGVGFSTFGGFKFQVIKF